MKGKVHKLIVGRWSLAASRNLKLSFSSFVFTSTIAMWKLSRLLITAERASVPSVNVVTARKFQKYKKLNA